MGAKNGMETGHLKSHIEPGRLALLQEMGMRVRTDSIESLRQRALHPPVLNFLRKSHTIPLEVGPGHTLKGNAGDKQNKERH